MSGFIPYAHGKLCMCDACQPAMHSDAARANANLAQQSQYQRGIEGRLPNGKPGQVIRATRDGGREWVDVEGPSPGNRPSTIVTVDDGFLVNNTFGFAAFNTTLSDREVSAGNVDDDMAQARKVYEDWTVETASKFVKVAGAELLKRANHLADECGRLTDENRELSVENSALRRKVERLERKGGQR